MPPLTRQQLAHRRQRRRSELRRRRRRTMASAAVPAVLVALLTAALWIVMDRAGEDPATTTEAAPIALGPGNRPKDIRIAQAGLVELRMPVDQTRITAIAFHASDNPAAVELTPASGLDHHTAPSDGRPGPERAAVDVGAPAGTLVFSPVDAVVVGVSDWVLRGKVLGYQVSLEPQDAGDVLVLVSRIREHAGQDRPRVGEAVRAGITPLGEVLDLSGEVEQELSQFTADAGNHVAIEVVRTGLD